MLAYFRDAWTEQLAAPAEQAGATLPPPRLPSAGIRFRCPRNAPPRPQRRRPLRRRRPRSHGPRPPLLS
jgi:hypothetical protein